MKLYLRTGGGPEVGIDISVIYLKCISLEYAVKALTSAIKKGYYIIESSYEMGKGTYIQFQINNGSAMIVANPEITGVSCLVVHDDICIPEFKK